ncbi:MAG: hypothetical protein KDD60_04370 [Bdellovibrionales bacterium]|nr:hypothetical protein [Bdellovibrionales bacterium]
MVNCRIYRYILALVITCFASFSARAESYSLQGVRRYECMQRSHKKSSELRIFVTAKPISNLLLGRKAWSYEALVKSLSKIEAQLSESRKERLEL